MVQICEIADDDEEVVHVTMDARGRVVHAPSQTHNGDTPKAAAQPTKTAPAKGSKSAARGKKSVEPKGFSVIDGTVVSSHERVDEDILSEVEKELGNEAFREKDYDTAVEHYSTALEAISGADDASNARARLTLLLNRAQARIKLDDFAEAKQDCAEALRLDPASLKALYRGALACYKLQDYQTALTWLDSAMRLAPDDVEVAVLMHRCRSASTGAVSEARVKAAAAAAVEEHGTASRDSQGRVFSPSGLLVVEELVKMLIDADDEDSGFDAVDVRSVLSQLQTVLQAHEDHRTYFACCLGHLAVMLLMDEEYGEDVGKVLRVFGGASKGVVSWPLTLLERLEHVITQEDSPEKVIVLAMGLLEHAASDPSLRSGAMVEPGADGESSVMQRLMRSVTKPTFRDYFPAEAACALCRLLQQFTQDAASRAALAAADVAPLAILLMLYQEAEKLPGAFVDFANLPMSLQEAQTAEEATRFMNTKKKEMYNQKAVELRRHALQALAILCRDTNLLRAEAFQRRSSKERQVKTFASSFLPQLLDIIKQLRVQAPLKTAPVLGLDGKPKSYEKKPYAADYMNNPVGDFVVNMPDFEVETTEKGDMIVDGNTGAAMLKEGQGVTLIELALEVLISCTHNKNASKTLHSSGGLGALERLWDYTTMAVLHRVQRIYARMAMHCEGVVEELAYSSNTLPLAGLIMTRDQRLILKGAERLLCIIATCSGDDFTLWTSPNGGLNAIYDLLCKMDADPSAIRDPKAAGGRGGFALYHACQQVYMQSLERARIAYGRNHGNRPPTGACWDVFGPMEVLRMEEKIMGVKHQRPRGAAQASSARPLTSTPKPAPSRSASASVKSAPPSKPAANAAKVPDKENQLKEQVKLKPLPWDPTSVGASAAKPQRSSPKQEDAIIKTGFFGPRRKTRAAQREEEAKKLEKEAVRKAAEAAAAREREEEEQQWRREQDGQVLEPEEVDEFDEEFEEEYEQWKQDRKQEMEKKKQEAIKKATRGKLGSDKPEEEKPKEYDEDGLRTKWDSAPSEDTKDLRRVWLNTDLRDKLRWTQGSAEVSVWVKVPPGTRKNEIQVEITPTRMMVKLHWYGRVVDGPLFRRCKASEACWVLQDDEVHVMLPKDDGYFWKGLFEGGEEKSHYEVLKDLVAADDPVVPYDELPERAKDLIFDMQEHQELINEGMIDPDGFDDFRVVLGDGDGAK